MIVVVAKFAPAFPTNREAKGVITAKHSTGSVVSRPAWAALRESSSLICPVMGATATIGPRRMNPMNTMPSRSRTGKRDRAAMFIAFTLRRKYGVLRRGSYSVT